MGVKQLLQYVQHACHQTFIHKFRGSTIGIDVSCLIYKGLYNGDYIAYIRLYVDLLTRLNCIIVLVFDGRAPETKSETLRKRRPLPTFDKTSDIADYPNIVMRVTKEVVQNVKRTFDLYNNVIIFQARGETDPQLAYLSLRRYVDLIVTDDSDLIVYGCEKIAFKLAPYGKCILYERCNLRQDIHFTALRWACILAGCDYLPGGLRGMGLTTATLVLKSMSLEPPYNLRTLRRVLLRIGVNEEFIIQFFKAERTFTRANVLDPLKNEYVQLKI